MFRALFCLTLFVTLAVNIIFLFATKDKPPDAPMGSSTFISPISQPEEVSSGASSQRRRLVLRSNAADQLSYDYAAAAAASGITAAPSGRRQAASDQPEDQDDGSRGEVETESNNLATSQLSSPLSLTSSSPAGIVTSRLAGASGELNSPSSQPMIIISEPQTIGNRTAEVRYRGERPAGRRELEQQQQQQHQASGWTTSTARSRKPPVTLPIISRRNRDNRQRAPLASQATDEDSAGDGGGARWLNIRVKSSKSQVSVSVDGNLIYESKSSKKGDTAAAATDQDFDQTNGRGIHVLVLNQFHGYLMSRRVFDTYSPQQDEELAHYLDMLREGRILVLAVKDEGSFKMAPGSLARKTLQKLGSRQIKQLKWRDMWAVVLRKESLRETDLQVGESLKSRLESQAERVNLAEALKRSASFADWAEPVEIEARVALLDGKQESEERRCNWQASESSEDQRRRQFCDRIEGYGQVCDCDSSGNSLAPITFEPPEIENNQLADVPILVMASNRPYYLYRMLKSLLQVHGIKAKQIIVFIDGFYQEPLMVCRLLNLRAIQQKPRGQRSARISHHYKSSLTAVFELFPRAQFAIIFEEDLDVARDALVYFNRTLPLLREDPTLYCVSAWNDQGYEHTIGKSEGGPLIYRIETMPGLGWMLSRKLYKEELEPQWPAAEQPHDWDMWIRTAAIRKGRECLIPDISRTFHFGSSGTNINSYFQREYFSKHAFYSDPKVRGFEGLDKLKSDAYELMMEQLVKSGSVVTLPESSMPKNATDFLCSLVNNPTNDNLTTNNKSAKEKLNSLSENKSNYTNSRHDVIFIEMIDSRDFRNWLKLAKCWRIWDLDARGQHKSAWRLHLNGRPTLVIGAPASPYSHFKPKELIPFNVV